MGTHKALHTSEVLGANLADGTSPPPNQATFQKDIALLSITGLLQQYVLELAPSSPSGTARHPSVLNVSSCLQKRECS